MADHTIVIVDDHPLFRDALSQTLSQSFGNIDIRQAGSLDDLMAILNEGAEADLVLLDLNMPGVHGFSGLIYLRAERPDLPVVVVSANEDPLTIRRAMDLGASGYIPKSEPTAEIRKAITAIIAGETWTPARFDLSSVKNSGSSEIVGRLSTLTPQQVRVLMMLGEGLLNKQIAFKLDVSEATVKAHVSAILQKLDVDSRTQAVIAVNRIEQGDWQRLSEAR